MSNPILFGLEVGLEANKIYSCSRKVFENWGEKQPVHQAAFWYGAIYSLGGPDGP